MTRLIFGIAYNSKGEYKTKAGGKITKAYYIWRSMVKRCYDPKFQIEQPTYKGCTINQSWHDFQDFAKWFYSHKYSNIGYELDKDILVAGNRVYGPETCCFVPRELNSLMIEFGNVRGKYPQGVCWEKDTRKYKAQMAINGKNSYLGRFDCPSEAYDFYKQAKESYVKTKALEWKDRIADNVFQALISWQP